MTSPRGWGWPTGGMGDGYGRCTCGVSNGMPLNSLARLPMPVRPRDPPSGLSTQPVSQLFAETMSGWPSN
jgi:hypothetical protein